MRTLDGRTIAAAGPRALAWGTAKRLRSHSPSSICYWVTAPMGCGGAYLPRAMAVAGGQRRVSSLPHVPSSKLSMAQWPERD